MARVRDGETLLAGGPYLEGKQHVRGITIVQAPDPDTALAWVGKPADASTLPVEVRPFLDNRDGLE